jgi:hypothetical protein
LFLLIGGSYGQAGKRDRVADRGGDEAMAIKNELTE